MNGCLKYDIDSVGDFNMAIGKDIADIIVDTRKMIRECLWCAEFKSKKGCSDSYNMVSFLEKNEPDTLDSK